jgi:hypothetical protein
MLDLTLCQWLVVVVISMLTDQQRTHLQQQLRQLLSIIRDLGSGSGGNCGQEAHSGGATVRFNANTGTPGSSRQTVHRESNNSTSGRSEGSTNSNLPMEGTHSTAATTSGCSTNKKTPAGPSRKPGYYLVKWFRDGKRKLSHGKWEGKGILDAVQAPGGIEYSNWIRRHRRGLTNGELINLSDFMFRVYEAYGVIDTQAVLNFIASYSTNDNPNGNGDDPGSDNNNNGDGGGSSSGCGGKKSN